LKAPSVFANRDCGKTLITKTQGTKIASEGLKGRVFEISLADLNKDEDQMYRKVKLCCEDVQGYNVMTNFHGMDLTRDKLCSLIKKWVTLIEANVDVKTTDGETPIPVDTHTLREKRDEHAGTIAFRHFNGLRAQTPCNTQCPWCTAERVKSQEFFQLDSLCGPEFAVLKAALHPAQTLVIDIILCEQNQFPTVKW
jgi:hypothetical protein